MLDRLQHLLNQLTPGAGTIGLLYGLRWLCSTGVDRLTRRRQLRRTPAAPDNQQGRDMGLLQECRLIDTAKPTSRKGKKP